MQSVWPAATVATSRFCPAMPSRLAKAFSNFPVKSMCARENELSYCHLQTWIMTTRLLTTDHRTSVLLSRRPVDLSSRLLWWQTYRLLPRSRHGCRYTLRSLLLAACPLLLAPCLPMDG